MARRRVRAVDDLLLLPLRHEPHHRPSYSLYQEIHLKSHGFLAGVTRIDRWLLGLGAGGLEDCRRLETEKAQGGAGED